MINTNVFSQVGTYVKDARAYAAQTYSSYETVRAGIDVYAHKKVSQKNAELVSRITSSVSEVFVDLCVLTGIFVFPATIIYGVKRCIPLSKYAMEYLKKGSTQESRKVKWEEIKKDYTHSFHNTMGPALLVALSVHALFWLTYGLVTFNAPVVFKTVALSLPTCYFVYKALVSESEEIIRPQPRMPESVQGALLAGGESVSLVTPLETVSEEHKAT